MKFMDNPTANHEPELQSMHQTMNYQLRSSILAPDFSKAKIFPLS